MGPMLILGIFNIAWAKMISCSCRNHEEVLWAGVIKKSWLHYNS